MSFRVNQFRNTSAKRLIFFRQCFKFNVQSKNSITHSENVFSFSDNCLSIVTCNFSQLLPEYSSSVLNVLKSSPKISDFTKNDFS